MKNVTDPAEQPTRRGFLDWIIYLGSAVTGLALTIPAVAYLWPAARGGGGDAVEVTDAANLSPGQSTMVQLRGKAVIVVCDRSGFRAFSAACTHLGCLVTWDGARREFLCPCHAAIFDDQGSVASGPSPKPLPGFKVKEIGGRVYVSDA